MKSTLLILACTFQNIFRTVSSSQILSTWRDETPKGVGDFDPSGSRDEKGIKEADGEVTKKLLELVGRSSPVKFGTRLPIIDGRVTPIDSFLKNSAESANEITNSNEKNLFDPIPHVSRLIEEDEEEEFSSDEEVVNLTKAEAEAAVSSIDSLSEALSKVSINQPAVTVSDVDDSDDDDFINSEYGKQLAAFLSAKEYAAGRKRKTGSVFYSDSEEEGEGEGVNSKEPCAGNTGSTAADSDSAPTATANTETTASAASTTTEPFDTSSVNLSDYQTIADFVDLSRDDRMKLYAALSDRSLKSISVGSDATLASIPPALFLLKISFKVRLWRGSLLTREEMEQPALLRQAIFGCAQVMNLNDWCDVIELMYRAGLKGTADNFLYEVVVPHIYTLKQLADKSTKPHTKFLLNLATHGHIHVLINLFEDASTSRNLRINIRSPDICFILQFVLTDGWTSDEEALQVMKLLLRERKFEDFIGNYGNVLASLVEGKRGSSLVSILQGKNES